ncbi:ferritin-like domain-containing protein [Luteolibacter sp. AS25]|uniref:YciE/YciF ferroxidase family protein n=1 Tax=Luteolibacter sp. AS25 TaxID=3135776 RepID=UPI00398B2CF7
MTKNELHSLLVEQLRDILWAEKHLVKALPKMAKAATDPNLKEAFESHLEETKGHVDRLKEVFKHLDLTARAKKCDAMEGLLSEADEIKEDFEGSEALDAALICAAQKVEHYEIATYGSLRAFAKRLGYKEIVDLLQTTLDEEGAADKKLTKIALADCNDAAA